jgi:hypothetical protein
VPNNGGLHGNTETAFGFSKIVQHDRGAKFVPETFRGHHQCSGESICSLLALTSLRHICEAQFPTKICFKDDLYAEAVHIKAVDVTHTDPKAVDAVIAAGGKETWDANLTKLNKHARDFGGKIAEIIAAGSPRAGVGSPRLVIEPRASALKAVGKS